MTKKWLQEIKASRVVLALALVNHFLINSTLSFAPSSIPFFRQDIHSIVASTTKTQLKLSSNRPDGSLEDDEMKNKTRIYDDFFKESMGGLKNQEIFQNMMQSNPFEEGIASKGGKSSLYSDEELMSLLSTHEELSEHLVSPTPSESSEPVDSMDPLSLHDLVKNMIEKDDSDTSNVIQGSDLSLEIQEKIPRIRAIASDVDGTILSSSQNIHPITSRAIKQAVGLYSTYSVEPMKQNETNQSSPKASSPFFFFPATGKSRKGAFASLGEDISQLLSDSNIPGVYLQGLFCVDSEQNVVFEQKLSQQAITAVEEITTREKISIVGYDGDFLCTTGESEIVRHLSEHYGEPLPALLEGGKSLAEYPPLLHKILLLDDDTKKLSDVIRPQLEVLCKDYNITITQAIPTMLEVLPAGCSKAVGVEKLCQALGIDMETELLALGDAENDTDMLRKACIGVAMGNGCDLAKNSADIVMPETNDEGAAGIAMEKFGLDKYR